MSAIDEVKNKAQETKGHMEEAVGKAAKDSDLGAKGKSERVSANFKQAGEKVKDTVKK